MREKLLQARKLEKTYQREQGKKQIEASKDFVYGLKKLGIDSISKYHKLVKEFGHKERNIKVVYTLDAGFTTAINQAVDTTTDTLIMCKSTKDVIYAPDVNDLGDRVNMDYCKKNNILFVDIVLKGQGGRVWLSLKGNYNAMLVLSAPIDSSAVLEKEQEAVKNALKLFFNIDIQFNKNGDGIVNINKKKICGSNLKAEINGMIITPIGLSLKKIESKAALIFPIELRHASQNNPTSVEDVLGKEVNVKEFVVCLIKELSKSLESSFNDN